MSALPIENRAEPSVASLATLHQNTGKSGEAVVHLKKALSARYQPLS